MFTLAFLRTLRLEELRDVMVRLPPGSRVLEIGAGSGEQAAALVRAGFDVSAIDMASSNYRDDRVFDVKDYDGLTIPFADGTFDVVYSSNVLEHVEHIDELQREILRVLRPDGIVVHLMPTPGWRLWTGLTVFISAGQAGVALLKALGGSRPEGMTFRSSVKRATRRLGGQVLEAVRQPCHGVRGSRMTELYYFSRKFWVKHFERNGFAIVEQRPGGLFYTGYMVLGERLSPATRRRLSRWLGSACNLFVVRANDDVGAGDAVRAGQR